MSLCGCVCRCEVVGCDDIEIQAGRAKKKVLYG